MTLLVIINCLLKVTACYMFKMRICTIFSLFSFFLFCFLWQHHDSEELPGIRIESLNQLAAAFCPKQLRSEKQSSGFRAVKYKYTKYYGNTGEVVLMPLRILEQVRCIDLLSLFLEMIFKETDT